MFIDYLKESPDCLYIYNRDFSIYGFPNKERYTIIVKDSWVCPEEWEDYNREVYQIIKLEDWFNLVLEGDLLPWECACLNKKYVIKEHVKLVMTTNPLQLRNSLILKYNKCYYDTQKDLENAICFIKDIRFAIQIINNHKIVNFKEAAKDYTAFNKLETKLDRINYVADVFKELENLTDGIWKQDILNRAKKEWAK